MSLPAFQTTVVNGTGDILTAATVTVTVEATGAAAVLFSDRNGTIGLGSGGVFPVNGTTAFAQFFVAPGEYKVVANDAVSGFSETWRYVVLSGTASLVDTGLLTGNVPTADDLSMVGQTVNYTGGNLNPNVFGGNVSGDIVGSGIFSTNGLLNCFLKLVSKTNPVSITVVGTFAIYDDTGVLRSTISTPTLSLDSSNKEALLLFGGAGGVNIRTETYTVRAVTAASKITVNF